MYGSTSRYLMRNYIPTSQSVTNIDTFTIALPTAKVAIVPSKKYTSLYAFIQGAYADGKANVAYGKATINTFPFLCFQLVDNLPLLNTKYYVSDKSYYLTAMSGNALSAIWHTSYLGNENSFQSTVAEDKRTTYDMEHKLNLAGLVN